MMRTRPSRQPASRPTSWRACADLGDAPVNPVDLDDSLERIEKLLRQGACRRRAAAVGRRRSSDHAADHARASRKGAGADRHGAFRRPHRHLGHAISATTNTPTARRSAARSRRGCSTPSARCRSASAARSTSATTRTGRVEQGMRVIYYRGVFRARRREGDRRGAPRRRRRADLCQLRRRRARSGLCARHRHAGDRRLSPPHEAQRMLRGLRGLESGRRRRGRSLAAVRPSGNTALVGATMMFEILCLLAEAVARRKGRIWTSSLLSAVFPLAGSAKGKYRRHTATMGTSSHGASL